MKKKIQYYKIAKEAFINNENITNTLIKHGASKSESIELSYELQAGEYTLNFSELNLKRNKEIHSVINKYTDLPGIESVGVFGIGEAKNWIGFEGVIKNLYGVEIAFSRLGWAHRNLNRLSGISNFQLIKGDTSEKIFRNNSFDISITLHSIEPNGNEQGSVILNNVVNSAAKYILLFEPDFSTGHTKMKERMLKHDYVRNISEQLAKMKSINIIEKYVMDVQETEDNLTTCWVIEKKKKEPVEKEKMIDPYLGEDVIEYDDMMYSPSTGLIYPKIDNFILLNKKDAIFIGKKDLIKKL